MRSVFTRNPLKRVTTNCLNSNCLNSHVRFPHSHCVGTPRSRSWKLAMSSPPPNSPGGYTLGALAGDHNGRPDQYKLPGGPPGYVQITVPWPKYKSLPAEIIWNVR